MRERGDGMRVGGGGASDFTTIARPALPAVAPRPVIIKFESTAATRGAQLLINQPLEI